MGRPLVNQVLGLTQGSNYVYCLTMSTPRTSELPLWDHGKRVKIHHVLHLIARERKRDTGFRRTGNTSPSIVSKSTQIDVGHGECVFWFWDISGVTFLQL